MTPDEKREYQREYWRKRREADPEGVRADNRERNRRYRERDREGYNARWRAWAAENKGRIHGYYAANAEVVKERSRRRYEENREELLKQMSERQRERLQSDPEFYQSKLDAWQKRRALKLANGPVDDIDRRAVWGRDSGLCTICGGFVPFGEMELDHIVPLSQGGTHTWNNVQTACVRCNRSKGPRILLSLAGRAA